MTNGEMIQKVFNCEVCEPIIEDDIIHVIFADKKDSAIGFDWSWWNAEYKEHKSEAKIDCIDRAELLKAMDTWNKFGNVPYEGLIRLSTPALQDLYVPYVKYDDMVNCVKGMSSVTPQEPKWIPFSKRLPEKTGWYLITFRTYGGGYAVSDMCYRKPENYWTRDNICKKVLDNDEVVAWMPLPKPYEPQESEDK